MNPNLDRLQVWFPAALSAVRITAIIIIGANSTAFPQQPERPNAPGAQKFKGDVLFHTSLANAPKSLSDLVSGSALIVDGLVDSSNIPARLTSANDPTSIETDIVFLIDKFYKGSLNQAHFPRVVISEIGGQLDGVRLIPAEHRVMEQGEHYLLFLAPDTRKGLRNIARLPRYSIAGTWAGKFKFENGKITAPKHVTSDIGAFELMDYPSMIGMLRKALQAAQQAGQPEGADAAIK